jgi:drug/metabolite transporter (DMT)-like permease
LQNPAGLFLRPAGFSVLTMTNQSQPPFPPVIALVAGVFAMSISAILIRLAQDDASSLVIAAVRLTIATGIMLPFALFGRRQELRQINKADWRLVIFAGLMLALHFVAWTTSLAYTSVASSMVLVTTTPLWVGLASPFLLHESLSRPLKIGILLAVAGSLIIGLADLFVWEGGRFVMNDSQLAGGRQPLLGNALALFGAITGAAYFMVGRHLRPRLSLVSYTTLVYGTAALALLLVVLLRGERLTGYSPTTYLLFVLMALFPQLLGHSSYNWALGYLPAAYVVIVGVSEPIGASLLAFLFFGEIPGPLVFVGSLLILAGVVSSGRRS